MSLTPAIIIPAYARANSLLRLLESINKGNYPTSNINLIISLEGGAGEEVIRIAKEFSFSHGKKELVYHKEKRGLREHILWCGDQSLEYGSIILLEDDLLVDSYYYLYALEALNFYSSDSSVAGIALYSPRRNEYVGLPFEPLYNGTSSYPMQIPCSWGQAWDHQQWKSFKKWYSQQNSKDIENCFYLPDKVKRWPESSWKKYFAAYLVHKNLFFIYPYISYTTNCSDSGGTHIPSGTHEHQVSLPFPCRNTANEFTFELCENATVSYDSFFEASQATIRALLNDENLNDFSVDLYGSKPLKILSKNKFALTTKEVKKPKYRFGLVFKPIELNVYYNNTIDSTEHAFLGETENITFTEYATVKTKLANFLSNISVNKLQKYFTKECVAKYENSISWKITKPLRFLQQMYDVFK